MSLVNKIRVIVKKFIIEKYNEYLKNECLLMIENKDLSAVINEMYSQNIKNLKIIIREQLKRDMGSEYPNGSIENILFDLFQDKELNQNRMIMEINEHQKKNYCDVICELDEERNLGINLSVDQELCVCYINGIREDCQLPNMEIIEKYQYLYSINGIILKGNPEYIIGILRDNIKENINSNIVKLGLYGLYDTIL